MSRLVGANGQLLWEGSASNDSSSALACVPGGAVCPALVSLCGAAVPTCPRGAVVREAERLGFVSRRGSVPGFMTLLPRGVLLDRCVESFNETHLAALRCVRIDFPLVFDAAAPGMPELTDGYERQSRMFRLSEDSHAYRLSYAADPGLLALFRGQRMNGAQLPYAVYSPTPVLRRLQSGEVGGLDRLRQFNVPDLHLFCLANEAWTTLEHCVALAAAGARFWVGDEFALFVDVVKEFDQSFPELSSRIARAAGHPVWINVLSERPRYYAFRAGILVHAGHANIMLYNLQWDDTNPGRFDIRTVGGGDVVILHATAAAGCPKLLPIMLGRGLCGSGPRRIPAELAASQIVCLPVAARHHAAAVAFCDRLRLAGIRGLVEGDTRSPLKGRLQRLRDDWNALHVVIGDREAAGAEPLITPTALGDPQPPTELPSFISRWGPRLERCRPTGPVFDVKLPF